jgi:hypothetical protein
MEDQLTLVVCDELQGTKAESLSRRKNEVITSVSIRHIKPHNLAGEDLDAFDGIIPAKIMAPS